MILPAAPAKAAAASEAADAACAAPQLELPAAVPPTLELETACHHGDVQLSAPAPVAPSPPAQPAAEQQPASPAASGPAGEAPSTPAALPEAVQGLAAATPQDAVGRIRALGPTVFFDDGDSDDGGGGPMSTVAGTPPRAEPAQQPPSGFAAGFHSAGGKPMVVSPSAMYRGRKLLANSLEVLANSEADAAPQPGSPSPHQQHPPSGFTAGFQTAGGKPMVVSPSAMERGRKLLADSQGDAAPEPSSPSPLQQQPLPGFTDGFQTVGSKPMEVSATAMERGRALLAGIQGDSAPQPRPLTRQQPQANDPAQLPAGALQPGPAPPEPAASSPRPALPPAAAGFQTSGAKPMEVSSTAMERGRALRADSQGNAAPQPPASEPRHPAAASPAPASSPPAAGFQTAGGKTVPPAASEAAMRKTVSFFDDKSAEQPHQRQPQSPDQHPPLPLQQTGGSRALTSKEAQAKAAALLAGDASGKPAAAATEFRSPMLAPRANDPDTAPQLAPGVVPQQAGAAPARKPFMLVRPMQDGSGSAAGAARGMAVAAGPKAARPTIGRRGGPKTAAATTGPKPAVSGVASIWLRPLSRRLGLTATMYDSRLLCQHSLYMTVCRLWLCRSDTAARLRPPTVSQVADTCKACLRTTTYVILLRADGYQSS